MGSIKIEGSACSAIHASIPLQQVVSASGVSSLLEQFGERPAITRVSALFITMAAVVDDLVAARVDVANRRLAMFAEYNAREPRVRRVLGDARMIRVEHQPVGAAAGLQCAHCATGGMRATF